VSNSAQTSVWYLRHIRHFRAGSAGNPDSHLLAAELSR
jgi:hypothetical protein